MSSRKRGWGGDLYFSLKLVKAFFATIENIKILDKEGVGPIDQKIIIMQQCTVIYIFQELVGLAEKTLVRCFRNHFSIAIVDLYKIRIPQIKFLTHFIHVVLSISSGAGQTDGS